MHILTCFLFILFNLAPCFGDEVRSLSKKTSFTEKGNEVNNDKICEEAIDKKILELRKNQDACSSDPDHDSLSELVQLAQSLKGSIASYEELKIDLQTSKDVEFIKKSVMDRMNNDSQYQKLISGTIQANTKINFYTSSDPKCEGNYNSGQYWPYPTNEIRICIQENNPPKTIASYLNTVAHESLHAIQDLANPKNTKPPKDIVLAKINDDDFISSNANKYVLNQSYKKDYAELLNTPNQFTASLSKELADEYMALEEEFGKFEKYFFLNPTNDSLTIIPKKPKHITDEKFYEDSESHPDKEVCPNRKIPFPRTKVLDFLLANPEYCVKTTQEIATLYAENLQKKNKSFMKKLSSNQQKKYFKLLNTLYIGHGRYLGALTNYCQEIHGNIYSAILDGQRRLLLNQIPGCKQAHLREGSRFRNSDLTIKNLDSQAEESAKQTVQNAYADIFSGLYSLKDFDDIFNQKNCTDYVSWDKYQN